MVRAGTLAAYALASIACTGQGAGPAPAPTPGDAATSGDTTVSGPRADAAPVPSSAPPEPTSAALEVPRARAPFWPTGHFRIQIWANAANTHTLLDAQGKGAVPMNEARFLWDDAHLYVFFYGGDLDLESRTTKHDGPVWTDDSIALIFPQPDGSQRVIQIGITGVVADGVCPADAAALSDARCDLKWESGVRAATDADGTLNKIGDNDEEWAIEAAIPLAAIGVAAPAAGRRVPFAVRRCDMQHDGPHECGAWGERPPGVLLLER
jgi:hypothetical protein